MSKAITGILAVIVIAFIMCIPLMLLWNWRIDDIFGLPRLDLFDALCLSLVCSMLFKGSS